jgi:hypothetical protein
MRYSYNYQILIIRISCKWLADHYTGAISRTLCSLVMRTVFQKSDASRLSPLRKLYLTYSGREQRHEIASPVHVTKRR